MKKDETSTDAIFLHVCHDVRGLRLSAIAKSERQRGQISRVRVAPCAQGRRRYVEHEEGTVHASERLLFGLAV